MDFVRITLERDSTEKLKPLPLLLRGETGIPAKIPQLFPFTTPTSNRLPIPSIY
jgi:hypothetical protein